MSEQTRWKITLRRGLTELHALVEVVASTEEKAVLVVRQQYPYDDWTIIKVEEWIPA